MPGRALNTTEGEIVDVATSKEPVGPGGQKVNVSLRFVSSLLGCPNGGICLLKASPDDPRYVIRNDNVSFDGSGRVVPGSVVTD